MYSALEWDLSVDSDFVKFESLYNSLFELLLCLLLFFSWLVAILFEWMMAEERNMKLRLHDFWFVYNKVGASMIL
jgi:hypothetical protein